MNARFNDHHQHFFFIASLFVSVLYTKIIISTRLPVIPVLIMDVGLPKTCPWPMRSFEFYSFAKWPSLLHCMYIFKLFLIASTCLYIMLDQSCLLGFNVSNYNFVFKNYCKEIISVASLPKLYLG